MRSALLRFSIAVIYLICFSETLSAQINTGLNGQTITLLCNQNCVTQPFQIPHLKTTSDYAVNSIAYNPYAYVTPGGIEDPNIYNDDRYSPMFDLPFPFCFYDSIFTKVSMGSNGIITFDYGLLNCNVATLAAAWDITTIIPFNSNQGSCSGGVSNYPKAAIMGVFQDLDPRPGPTFPNTNSSPPDRKIEWRVEGTAPFRRFIVSYYKIGVYETTPCGLATPATFQIVLYESTGVIDIFIENKICNSIGNANGNRAILGIQNWNRDKGLAAPGKNAVPWIASNQAYRFVPSGPISRFVSCELQTLNRTTIALGDTITTIPGLLDVTFPSPSLCPTAPSTQYVIKSTYSACDDPAIQIISYDTITVNKTNSLNAAQTNTQTGCGLTGTGSATITVPAGIGTAPYTFVLSPGGITLTGNSPQQFNNLTAGLYSVVATDASGGCTSTLPVTITSTGLLAVTYNITPTTCSGAANGQIVVNPPNGTPPITYSINGGIPTANNTFSGLAFGNYVINTRDIAGCVANDIVIVNSGAPLTMTTTSTPSSCPGANNGSITVTAINGGGTPPYQYSINGGLPQSSPTFPNLVGSANPYLISVVDAIGCSINFAQVLVDVGTGTVTGTASPTNTSCAGVNNGSITVTPNGTGPFQYSLNNGPYQSSGLFGGLAPGSYTVTIKEAGLCISSPISVTIGAGNGLQATLTPSNTTCTGASNGSVTATMNIGSGTAPFTFVLDGTVTQTSATNTTTFLNVSTGLHSVTITDASGCITSAPLTTTVTAGTGFTASAAPSPTGCAGATNGSLAITPQTPQGTAPFTIVLNPGAITQTGNGPIITFNNLAAGIYSAVITDANGCQSTLNNMNVAAGAGLVATPTPVGTSCSGVNNGSISITSNGTPPLTFVLDGSITQVSATNSTSFINLAAGSHSITVRDAIGCVTTTPVTTTVLAGTGFTASAAPGPTSCAGATNGSLVITPQTPQGTAPFTIVLNPGAITQTGNGPIITFNNLAAGIYSAVITDANGCQSTLNNMNVAAGAGLVATPTPVGTSCSGVNNGSISITSNGTPPLTFVLDGSITQVSATNTTSFINLAAGSHSITVRDAIGCVTTTPVTTTVLAGTGFTASAAPSPTGCAGATNGSLAITPQTPQGTAPFTIVLNPGAITQTGNGPIITFNNLAAGTYSAVITDANGCQSTLNNMNVVAGAGLVATPTPVGTSCSGVNNGSISITSNGTPPLTFVLDGSITQVSATNSTSFINVAAGSHSITVRDAIGCVTTTPVTTTVLAGTGFTASAAPSPTGCAGATNGSLAITPQTPQGTAPFTIVLNPGAITQTGNGPIITFNNLAAGIYSAVITDANGCQFTLPNMTVATGSALNAIPNPVGTTCNGANNGSINVQAATNGTAPYLYSLNGGTPQAGPAFNGLAAGTYIINVTDAGGCSSGNLTTTINPGPFVNVRPDKVDVACFGSLTGRITAVPSLNATAPIQYSLDNVTWQASPNFTGLAAATYNVYIIDAVGCTNSADTTIGQPLQLTATPSQQSVLCNNGNDGKIFINASGGTAPYSYSLDNITFQPGSQFNVMAGSYVVYVKDANGCTIPQPLNVNVTEPALLTAISAATNATCGGGNDGTITINSTGGVSPYQYAITGSTFQPAGNFNVGPGTYDITVKDVNGCTYPVTGVIVGLTNDLTYTPMIDPAPICEGKAVSLQLITNATQFAWTNGGSLSSSAVANPMAQPSDSTLYTVIATLGRCTITDDVLVPVMPAPLADAGPPGDICYGKTYQLQGSGGTTYSWSPSTNLSNALISNPVVTPDKTITYSLSVTDANGCASLTPGQVIVKVTPPIKVSTYPFDTVVSAGVQIPLLATSVGTDYVWTSTSGTTGLDNPNIANPTAIAPLIDGSVVIYKVTATTSAGCAGDGFVKIQVYKGPDIYVVTAFTPNGDGTNETFIPFPVGIKKLNYFKVFNRWGQMLYSTTTLNKGWDGRLGGLKQPGGVYVWMVEGVTMDNKIITKKGTVTLIR